MATPSNPSFDYSLISPDDAGKVKHYEAELLRSYKRTVEEMLELGSILHDVQQILADYSNGTFQSWLAANGLSKRSAYNYIGAFVSFSGCANLHNLEVSAMYALTANEKAKKKALKLADKGVKVTHSMAKELLEAPAPKASKPPIADRFYREAEPETPATVEDSPPSDSVSEEDREALEDEAYDDGAEYEDAEEGEEDLVSPWSEEAAPARDAKEELRIQRAKTVKTIEAAMREFDTLEDMQPGELHLEAIGACKRALQIARGWK